MEKLLKRIDEKKRKLDSLRPMPPELVKNLDDWFKIERVYNSNNIEGNTLTKQETTLVVEKGITIGGKTIKEHLEATNLAFAIDYIKKITSKSRRDISLKDILNFHYLVLKKIDDKNAGKFRKISVKIAGSDAKLPEPLKVPELMDDFITWLHNTKEHVVQVAADAHLKLVEIHPFVDGNGRTARLLMNLILMQRGFPPAVIKTEDKLAYIKSISKSDFSGTDLSGPENTADLKDYYSVIFKAVEQSLDVYLEALEISGN